MRHPVYYRTSRADILAARKVDVSDDAIVQGRGAEFAALFNGVPLFTRGFAPQFAGITFTKDKQPQYPELWTKPSEKIVRRMPKDSGIPRKLVQASWELRNLWNTRLPKDIMVQRESKLLAALGISMEKITAENHELQYFERGNVAYVACTTPLDGLEEILATQYVLGAETPVVPAQTALAPEVS